jgi:tetratricopeptide (TPR) repeat protein/protein involved in polysaccharide export with SLBB domain
MKRLLRLTFVLSLSINAYAQGSYRADVYYRDGARLALEGRTGEAAAAFERAVALDPSNGNAFYSLGNVYSEMGRWDDAAAAYRKAVGLNRADVEAYNNLGIALAERGLYAQAEEALEHAVKIYPKWAEPYFHLSRVRRALGDEQGAREAYARALRPDYATSPPVRFRAASSSTKSDAPARTNSALKAMNALNLVNAPDARAGTNATGANTKTADANTRDANRTDASANSSTKTDANANDTNALGRSAPQASEAAEAPAGATRPAAPAPSTTVNPSTPAPVDARGYYEAGVRESRAGRYAEAIEALRESLLLDRSNASAYLALGDAYSSLGHWPEALDAYEQAARLKPDDAETYQRLGRAFAKLRESRPSKKDESKNESEAASPSTSGVAASPSISGDAASASPSGDAHDATRHEEDADPTAVYRIGPGDVLDVRVLKAGASPTTASYQVTPTGLLTYPALAEPLKVAGLTAEQIASSLGAALKLRAGGAGPEVAVGVREYASHAIIVSGMVKEAGTKILQREGVPLYVVIAYAQPEQGAGRALVVSRATGRSTSVDLSDANETKMLVRPGDVITVTTMPEQYVYVSGAVRQPGQKRFYTGLTLTQAVLAAGGALSAQSSALVAVTRQGEDGRLGTTRYSLADIGAGRTPDPRMRPGDRVEVLK